MLAQAMPRMRLARFGVELPLLVDRQNPELGIQFNANHSTQPRSD
jgi:hypothetical protein